MGVGVGVGVEMQSGCRARHGNTHQGRYFLRTPAVSTNTNARPFLTTGTCSACERGGRVAAALSRLCSRA
jgi:hypothetical protein